MIPLKIGRMVETYDWGKNEADQIYVILPQK